MRAAMCVVLAVLGLAAPAAAQFETASVIGLVRDASGGVVPDATITLTNTATSVSLVRTTNGDGGFEFPTVKAGPYVVTAEKAGFSVGLLADLQVQVGARVRADLQLTIGQLSERVEVHAATPLIDTESSQRGQVITGAQTQALPLNGREYSSLALLTSGVRQSALNRGVGTLREGAFNVNGLRSTFNNFLIDGVDNNAYGTSNQGFSNQVMQPAPDAVGEFKVVTNNMSAEYGRSAGATVNVAYRSGTNAFKGSVWEFYRDTGLNATGFFKPPSGQKPPLTRNQFGGVLGGPVVRNRAFFFADYEGFRQTRKQTSASTIPSAAQRQGVVSVAVRDPRTGTVYPAGTPIPMTGFARTVLGGLPDPNVAGAANNYVILQQFKNHTDKAGGKLDFQINPSISAFGRYGWRDLATDDQPPIPLPSGGAGNGHIYARNKQAALGATITMPHEALFEARFGWSTTEGGKNPPALGSVSALEAYGLSGLPTDARIAGGLPTQLITGYSDLGRQATNPQWQYPSVFNPKLNYTWLAGRHSLKAGYEFQRIDVEVQDVNPLYGRDSYSGQFTRPAGAAANNLYNLADFMLGLRSQYALSNVLVANIRQNLHFGYVQDDFRASNRLTLNLGLRYEYATPMWERDNVLSNYDPVARKMVLASSGSIANRTLVDPDRNNVGPRLGAAFTLTPQTVLRGGYGVSYVHVNRVGAGNLLPINGPQVINAVVVQTVPTASSFRPTELGYPAGLTDPSKFNPLAANITYMPTDFHSSPVQSWYASVQRQFGQDMVLDVAYVGNRARDLLLFANYNQATPNNAAGTLSLQSRRPIADFADITYAFNGGKSQYRALQLKYEWRVKDHLTLLTAFTWSQAKDNGAGSLENQNGNFPAPQDYYNLGAEFGTSGYDQPYNSTTSFVWTLPFGRDQRWLSTSSPVVDALLGGWQLAGINTFTSGEPVTFTYTPAASFQVSGIQQDFRGANNYRPNVVGDPYANTKTIDAWFNKDAVVIPTDPSHPFGNAARNTVRGPNFWQVDLTANKRLRLGGPASLEIRIEAFNLLNHTNFMAPNGNRSSAAFGTIRTTYDARQVQLGAKILVKTLFPIIIGLAAVTTVASLALETPTSPLIIAHRGASGHRPEHTLEAYRLAIEQGAHVIEPDLVSTRDGVLVARHENEIGATTDVAERFPDRRATKVVDGQTVSGWFVEDFTLAEIKTLRARERLAFRSHAFDGQFAIPTFAEVAALADAESHARGRAIAVYPETKHPSYFREHGLALEPLLLAELARHGWQGPADPVFVQSFERDSLQRLRGETRVRLVQLIATMPTDEALQTIKTYADGIGAEKRLVLPYDDAAGTLGPATTLVARAHAAGLFVHVWTLRSDPPFLPKPYQGDAAREHRDFVAAGVAGIFTDFPDTATAALRPAR